LALNSAENRLRVLMMDRPPHRRIHLNRLSQEVGPPLVHAARPCRKEKNARSHERPAEERNGKAYDQHGSDLRFSRFIEAPQVGRLKAMPRDACDHPSSMRPGYFANREVAINQGQKFLNRVAGTGELFDTGSKGDRAQSRHRQY
jgi:hypothetical protein